MKLQLNNGFWIRSDAMSVDLMQTLKKSKDSKNAGEEYDVNVGYYSTLEGALKGYIKHTTRRDKKLESVQDILDKLDELKEEIIEFRNKYILKEKK